MSVLEIRPWSELPCELLELVANRLAIVELVCFRSVCKSWRSASTIASAISPLGMHPWFLMYDDNNSKCQLFDLISHKSYTMHIPEMNGATCIASNGGWLLLYRESSMCFFCPFSRAKIDLPEFPHLEVANHVGVFTSTPTSSDCVVGVITHYREDRFEFRMLERGSNIWGYDILDFPSTDKITGATYLNGIFYFLDSKDLVYCFSLEKKEWTRYRIVPRAIPSAPSLPFQQRKNSIDNEMKQDVGLGTDDCLSICGTTVLHESLCIIHNEDFEAEDCIEVCNKKGVWFHPRFFQIPMNQSWFF